LFSWRYKDFYFFSLSSRNAREALPEPVSAVLETGGRNERTAKEAQSREKSESLRRFRKRARVLSHKTEKGTLRADFDDTIQ
jgi:hypothetical protein